MQHQAIRAGDIIRTVWISPEIQTLNLYQGSGRSGCCWNSWGLMNSPELEQGNRGRSRTVWMHADHWHRKPDSTDFWVDLGRITWAQPPIEVPTGYKQTLTLLDGRLTTHVVWAEGEYTLSSYFDPGNRDVLTMEISYTFGSRGHFPSLLFQPSQSWNFGADGVARGELNVIEMNRSGALLRATTSTVATMIGVRIVDLHGDCQLVIDPRGIRLDFAENSGSHIVRMGAANVSRTKELMSRLWDIDPKTSSATAAANWEMRWGRSWIQLPDPSLQALWARSHFYILCSYGPDVRSPAPPMGWSGNNWQYHFPQDLSYIHPALLRLGHLDIAKSWVEFYKKTIPRMKEYARGVFNADGVMWAWGYPIGESFESGVFPPSGLYTNQIHNVAYPARMAYETAQHAKDPAWTQEMAWPVIVESARFFASLLKQARDGKWDLRVSPSSGQDEFDVESNQNYLCSLFSAQYTLSAAVRMSESLNLDCSEVAQWRAILADGLAYTRLLDKKLGIYSTAEGVDVSTRLGRQKHPVQLNPLTFLPLGRAIAPTLNAYAMRHKICHGFETNEYAGWTLPAYWLADAHMGNGEGMETDLSLGIPTGNIDPDCIQIYESAKEWAPYFITSNGLYCQAVQDALVNDFWVDVEFGSACPDSWRDIAFGGLRTSNGRSWSGVRSDSKWKISEDA